MFFGAIAYAGISKGLAAITTGHTRLANSRGIGPIVHRGDWSFWAQIGYCWLGSVMGASFISVTLLAPLKRGA